MTKRPHTKTNDTLWLYGKHACLAALHNPSRKCLQLLVTQKTLAGVPQNQLTITPKITEAKQLVKLLPEGAVHQGIALQVKPLESVTIESLYNASTLVVLDQVTDPHNVGAILRSAAAFGADAVIAPKDHAPDENATLAKSASGALEAIAFARLGNLARTLDRLKKEGFWCVGLDGHADTLLHDIPKMDKIALIMGAEGRGLRQLTRSHCDMLAKLPISPKVESLNVSNAAAVALYQLSLPGR